MVGSFKEKLWKLNQDKGVISKEDAEKVLSVVNSYYGQFKHAKTFSLRLELWRKKFGRLRDFLEPVDTNFSYFNINEKYFRPNRRV